MEETSTKTQADGTALFAGDACRLYQPSIKPKRADRAACLVSNGPSPSSSILRLPKKLSIGALSQQSPFRLIEQRISC